MILDKAIHYNFHVHLTFFSRHSVGMYRPLNFEWFAVKSIMHHPPVRWPQNVRDYSVLTSFSLQKKGGSETCWKPRTTYKWNLNTGLENMKFYESLNKKRISSTFLFSLHDLYTCYDTNEKWQTFMKWRVKFQIHCLVG